MTSLVKFSAIFFTLCITILAQSRAAGDPKFEVASIKPCKADTIPEGRGFAPAPGRLALSCLPVIGLIRQSYILFADGKLNPLGRIEPIEGAPDWTTSERYSIEAKAEGSPSQGIMLGPMMRALLEDRFKLKIHRETKQVNVYALTLTNRGNSLPPTPKGGCITVDIDHPPPLPAPGKPIPWLCGMARIAKNGFDISGATMMDIGKALSNRLDRNVIDRTGIAGIFDIHLEWFPSDSDASLSNPPLSPGPSFGDPAAPTTSSARVDNFGAIQTALQKFGLKLEPAKGPSEFVVIDHIERPSEN